MRKGVQSVSALTFKLKDLVEGRFSRVAVEGEVISARPSSGGHLYFTLKDQRAQLPVVVWRSTLARLPLRIKDGMQVIVRGDIQIYPPHGRYQLVAQRVIEAGLGDQLARLQALKKRLAAEGLFDASNKRPLPHLPRRVGVVTARSGAALRDILHTLHRRYPTEVVLVPCRVQGAGAANSIARGIYLAGRQPGVQVVIVGRGGGSLEDLWAFNEEPVVRAIAGCPVPVVSAVGHEIDVLLSDLAADARAPTPTAAAEMTVPSHEELSLGLDRQRRRLADATRRHLRRSAERGRSLEQRLSALARHRVALAQRAHAAAAGRLANLHPRAQLSRGRLRLDNLARRLDAAAQQQLRATRRHLDQLGATLRALSPTRSLERGYAIVRTRQGAVLSRSTQASEGMPLELILHRGAVDVTVDGVRATNPYEAAAEET